MTPEFEQKIRSLLERAFERGCITGVDQVTLADQGYDTASLEEDNKVPCLNELMLEAWELLTYHAGRGDAAQSYLNEFLHEGETGKRCWSEFRWNEVYDRMLTLPRPRLELPF